MTPEQIELVTSTWARVAPIADTAAAMFYGRLFEQAPHLQRLFRADMNDQGKKLMQMLGVAVANLHQLDEVLVPVQELGKRHVAYGVVEQDYDQVGSALLWTLGAALKDDFTPAVEAAWTETYTTLASVMKAAAAAVDAA